MSEYYERKNLPLPFTIYKGVRGSYGALRFNLKRAYADDESKKPKRKKKDGCVFLEATPATAPNVYGWVEEIKVMMALSIIDIPKIITFLQAPGHPVFQNEEDPTKPPQITIFHDQGAGSNARGEKTKSLVIVKPQDKNSFFFNVTEREHNKETLKVTVPVSPEEALALRVLLTNAIPAILNWDSN
jgi:hypothetical protein